MNNKKSVLTIATGKPVYLEMAEMLCRSFLLWNDHNDIGFRIVTDNPNYFKTKLPPRVDIFDISEKSYPTGFAVKLFLDHFIHAEQNLFIDSDFLIDGDLISVFDNFLNWSFSAIGANRDDGEFIGDISAVRKTFKLDYLPQYVGAIFYLKNNEIAKNICSKARAFLPDYDNIGLLQLREKENEEPLFAISMAIYGQKAIEEDGQIKADRMFFTHIQSNVLNGFATLWNTHQIPAVNYFGIMESNPVDLHFNANFSDEYHYKKEVIRLTNKGNMKVSLEATLYQIFDISIYLITLIKNIFRPIYRLVFGYRPIPMLKRVQPN